MAEHFMELLCPAGNMDKLKMAIRPLQSANQVRALKEKFGNKKQRFSAVFSR